MPRHHGRATCVAAAVLIVNVLGSRPEESLQPLAPDASSLAEVSSGDGLGQHGQAFAANVARSLQQMGAQLAFDWLFDIQSKPCEYGRWDGQIHSARQHSLHGLLFVLAAAAVVGTGRCSCIHRKEGHAVPMASRYTRGRALSLDGAEADDEAEVGEVQRRVLYLDYARILAVACVVVEHGGGSAYSEHNMFFVQQWVMPLLYITSGACFALSRLPLQHYLLRCLAVLAIGIGANWSADVLTERDWRGDFGNTIFQMAYVGVLIVLAILLAPLKSALVQSTLAPTCGCAAGRKGVPQAGKAHSSRLRKLNLFSASAGKEDRQASGCCSCGCGFATPALLVCFWGAVVVMSFRYAFAGRALLELEAAHQPGPGFSQLRGVTENSPFVVLALAGHVFLSSLACLVGPSGWLGWTLLATTFWTCVLAPFQDIGRAHNLALFVFGMTVQIWPLAGHRTVARLVQSYWPLFIGVTMILGMPKLSGRCDLSPLDTYWERFRFYLVEVMIIVAFACGGFVVADPYRITKWLNQWALYAFCSHVAWCRLLPAPWGPVLTYSSAALFWLLHRISDTDSMD